MAGEASKKAPTRTSSSSSNNNGNDSSSKNNEKNALTSFLQQDAEKQAQLAAVATGGKPGIDWEEMSRGAYSTVSKMKSAKDRMMQEGPNTNTSSSHSPIKNTKKNNSNSSNNNNNRSSPVRRTRSSDGLSSFMEAKNAQHAARAKRVDSDDRSRGAHSTMSHDIRRGKSRSGAGGAGAGGAGAPGASGAGTGTGGGDGGRASPPKTRSFTHTTTAPFHQTNTSAEARREAAERKLATGSNPLKTKREKNLELFMSRQKPLPKQDLEVRSAFTSIDKARHRGVIKPPSASNAAGAAPLPNSREDLLSLLRNAPSGPNHNNKLSPKPSGSSEKIKPSRNMTAPALDGASNNNTITSSSSRTNKTPPQRATPKRSRSSSKRPSSQQRGATTAATTTTTKSSTSLLEQQPQQSATTSTTRIGKSESFRQSRKEAEQPTTQFSSLLEPHLGLDKPLPRRSHSYRETSSGTTQLDGDLLKPKQTARSSSVKKATMRGLQRSDDRHAADTSRIRSHSYRGTSSRTVKLDDDDMIKSKSVRPAKKASVQGICNEVDGSRSGPKKKTPSSSPAAAAAPGHTSQQIMSARRLHHAPERAVAPSPISGRRQSLKMGDVSGAGRTKQLKKKKVASSSSGRGGGGGGAVTKRNGHRKGVESSQTNNPPEDGETTKRRPNRPAAPPLVRRKASEDREPASAQRRTVRPRRKQGGATPSTAHHHDAEKRRGASTEGEEPVLEDVFTFYTWSEARQDEASVQRERQVLRDSIFDGGPLHRAFNRITAA